MALVEEDTDPDGSDLSIGLTHRLDVVLLLELLFELEIVRDDTVVDERDSLLMVKVRMGIHIGFVTVGCPSSMADTYEAIVILPAFEIKPLDTITTKPIARGVLIELEFASIWANRDNAARVITSGLKNVQSIDANISSLLLITKISNNTAALIGFLLLLQVVHIRHHTESSTQDLLGVDWSAEHSLDLVARESLFYQVSLHVFS